MRRFIGIAAALLLCVLTVRGEDKPASQGATIEDAHEVLGASNIVSAHDAAYRWGLPQPDPSTPLPLRYLRSTFEWAAEENECAGAEWRLVYAFGLSLNEESRRIAAIRHGVENLRHATFGPDRGTRSLDATRSDMMWMSECSDAGYRLVDFVPRFTKDDWYHQRRSVIGLHNVSRLHESTFVELVVSLYGSSLRPITEGATLLHRGPTGYSGESLRVRVEVSQSSIGIYTKLVDFECCCAGGTYVARDFDF